jgi:hypothetical protein
VVFITRTMMRISTLPVDPVTLPSRVSPCRTSIYTASRWATAPPSDSPAIVILLPVDRQSARTTPLCPPNDRITVCRSRR